MSSQLPDPQFGPVASAVFAFILSIEAYAVQSNPNAPMLAWASASLLSCVLIVNAFRSLSN